MSGGEVIKQSFDSWCYLEKNLQDIEETTDFAIPLTSGNARSWSGLKYSQSPLNTTVASIFGVKPSTVVIDPDVKA